MAGRDNNFVQVHLRLADHPAVLERGYAVHHVYTLLLLIARGESLDGRIRRSRATPRYLRLRFRLPEGPDGLSDAYLQAGIDGCFAEVDDTPALLTIDDDMVVFPGWEESYGHAPKTDAERKRNSRARLRQEVTTRSDMLPRPVAVTTPHPGHDRPDGHDGHGTAVTRHDRPDGHVTVRTMSRVTQYEKKEEEKILLAAVVGATDVVGTQTPTPTTPTTPDTIPPPDLTGLELLDAAEAVLGWWSAVFGSMSAAKLRLRVERWCCDCSKRPPGLLTYALRRVLETASASDTPMRWPQLATFVERVLQTAKPEEYQRSAERMGQAAAYSPEWWGERRTRVLAEYPYLAQDPDELERVVRTLCGGRDGDQT